MLVRNKIESLVRRCAALEQEASQIARGAPQMPRPPIREGETDRAWSPLFVVEQCDLVTRTLEFLCRGIRERAQELLDHIDRTAAETALSQELALEIELATIADRFQNYRDAIAQRGLEPWARSLAALDKVAADCYVPMMRRAQELGLIEEIGRATSPICYLQGGYSPTGWARKQDARWRGPFPSPLLFVPADRVGTPWSWLLVPHEIGHQVALTLTGNGQSLDQEWRSVLFHLAFQATGNTRQANLWKQWAPEIFADMCGALIAGPSFIASLQETLAFPRETMQDIDIQDVHPPHSLRLFIGTALLRTIGFINEAERLEQKQISIYGTAPGFEPFRAVLPGVVAPLTTLPLACLNGRAMADVIPPFTYNDYLNVTNAAQGFLNGTVAPDLRAIHAVCAAQTAYEAHESIEQTSRIVEAVTESVFQARTEEPNRAAEPMLQAYLDRMRPRRQPEPSATNGAEVAVQTVAGALALIKNKVYLDQLPVLGPTGEVIEVENPTAVNVLDDLNGRLVVGVGAVKRKEPGRSSKLGIQLQEVRDFHTGQLLQVLEN
jgi:hypothetical protein